MKQHPARFALIVCALFIYFSTATIAHANVKIAVVDVEQILAKSKASESIRAQVKSKRDKFVAQVKNEEDKLRSEQKLIEDQRSKLSKEELMQSRDKWIKKAQEFEKKRIDARNSIQTKKKKLDQAYSSAMNTLTKVIFDVCQEISDERKIDLVITRQNIIVGSMSLDITQDVMTRLNSKLPNITLQVK